MSYSTPFTGSAGSFTSPFTGDVIQPTDVSYSSLNLTANTQLQWPVSSNATLPYASRIIDVTPTGAYSIYMPPANQTSVGTDAFIRNLGSYTITIKDYQGVNTITTLTSGQAKYIYLTANPDTQGTWTAIPLGTGTSSPDASALAGYGLEALSSTLNQTHPAQSISNGYTFLASDRAQTKVWSGGAGSVTLPLASTLGNNWFTLFKNNGSGTLTINCSGANVFDTLSSKTFNPNESAFIVCDGTQYLSVGYGVSNIFVFTALTLPVVSGTYTLTTSQAQSVIQEYVGSLSGNVTVVFPPVVNLYVISNQVTDNGHNVYVTTGGSGNVVQVPTGQQASLICDGTNFFNANTTQAGATSLSMVNGSVGTPAINFLSENNTGIWHPNTGQFGISIQGTNKFLLTANGIDAGVF
jgi:hypothetical protein